MRFFTNINPIGNRVWATSSSFEELAQKYAGEKGVPFPSTFNDSLRGKWLRKMKQVARKGGIHVPLRSPYDTFMLRFHRFLKKNSEFQQNCPKALWEFPPNSCWIVFSDAVSHAALAGQYALEQTFLVPESSLLYPEKSPVRVLERLSGKNLVNPFYLSEMLSSGGRSKM